MILQFFLIFMGLSLPMALWMFLDRQDAIKREAEASSIELQELIDNWYR